MTIRPSPELVARLESRKRISPTTLQVMLMPSKPRRVRLGPLSPFACERRQVMTPSWLSSRWFSRNAPSCDVPQIRMQLAEARQVYLRKLHLISIVAKAVRANDLAAAGVARCRERHLALKATIDERLASAEQRKRALDASKLAKLQMHLAKISAACARRRELEAMRLLVAEHEASTTLNLFRPPPVQVPADAPADEDELIELCYDVAHGEELGPDANEDEEEVDADEEDDEAGTGYYPDEESGYSPSTMARHLEMEATPAITWRRHLVNRAPTPMRPRPEARALTAEELIPYTMCDDIYAPYELYEC